MNRGPLTDLVTVTLPSTVRAETGQGGLPMLAVDAPAGTAQVYLQGAHLVSWVPRGGRPVLWMSSRAAYEPGRALRGGIPLCFPWFGPSPSPSGAGAQHGFARTRDWTLTAVDEDGDTVGLTLSLTDSPPDRDPGWPYRFAARYSLRIGATLDLVLEVTNRDTVPITFEEALHTYLAVGDVRDVTVAGLQEQAYVDKVLGGSLQPATGMPLMISTEIDRVYGQPGLITVRDPRLGRDLQVRAGNSAHAVVWNPWADKAAAMADFGDDDWPSMLCVETANVLDRAITVAPGEAHRMTAPIEVLQPG